MNTLGVRTIRRLARRTPTRAMPRLGVLLLPLLVLAAVVGPVNAAGRDTVSGSGTVVTSSGNIFIAVGASSDATGGDPRGTIRVRWDYGGLEATADVTCVAVDGQHAVVHGYFREPINLGDTYYQRTEVRIGDYGGPDEDHFGLGFTGSSGGYFTIPPVTTCSAGGGGWLDPDRGNFVVQDAA